MTQEGTKSVRVSQLGRQQIKSLSVSHGLCFPAWKIQKPKPISSFKPFSVVEAPTRFPILSFLCERPNLDPINTVPPFPISYLFFSFLIS